MTPPSADWKPLFRSSPFLDLIGPLYALDADPSAGRTLVVGMRVQEKHCNARGTTHGGVLATLADISLGYASAFSVDPPAVLTTVNLTVDYAGAVKLGAWIESHVDIQRLGSRTAFANAYLVTDDTRIARASAVFARTDASPDRSPGR